MTIPAGYREWARRMGANPYHPDSWTSLQLASFMAWKREHVAARHRERIRTGTWSLMTLDQQETARREDERIASSPPPSRPWRVCPCHTAPTRAAESGDPLPTSAIEALAYIESFRPRRGVMG